MADRANPLLTDWHARDNNPHGAPPFKDIETTDYLPAFKVAFDQHDVEISAIVNNSDPATFSNTVEALERSGSLLHRISLVFSNETAADTSEALQDVETAIGPEITEHFTKIYTNTNLFNRVEVIIKNELPALSSEQQQLTRHYQQLFVRSGAALSAPHREKVQQLDKKLSQLQTSFSQNVLNDTNTFELHLTNPEDLTGLPESVRSMGSDEARRRGQEGYLFTISRSSITPFLQYAANRELRERIFSAYTQCGDNGNHFDNKSTVSEIASLRAERAKLLGYASHASFMLDDRMAGNATNVRELLDQVWEPARARVGEESQRLQQEIQSSGENFKLAPWDWWYYTEKVRSSDYNFDEEALKPYFELEQVTQGAFQVANKLYGLKFQKIDDFPGYHPDVQAYEVREADNQLIGLFLTDYFMRPSKRGGAWMTLYREQSNLDTPVYPIVVNVCNFPQGNPALLGLDEVRTLFHEFGHGLHGLLSNVTYEGLSGVNVKQDFVELPSQIMEHWALEPEVMKTYATHYETGEVVPAELIEKIQTSSSFNQGFGTTEYLAACYLDLAWHEMEENTIADVTSLEDDAMTAIGLVSEVLPRYRSTYFQHIFSDDSYSAGYYSYIWAEVLDADGYEAFVERGIFDQETARSFRKNILERGATDDPMSLYRSFRGREPRVEPLLKQRGLA